MWANAQHDGRPAEHRWRPLFNAAKFGWRPLLECRAKMRNLLRFAGVPQTPEPITAISGRKFTILWGHVEEVLLLNKFFPIVNTCLSCKDIARQSCAMVPRWQIFNDFLHPVFLASRLQHTSDLHSKFALRPHHVSKNGRHPMCGRWDQARKKDRKKKRKIEERKHRTKI